MEVCGSAKKRGGTCKRPAGWGTEHLGRGPCRLHGGMLPTIAAKHQQDAVVEELRYFGASLDVTPADLMLECVRAAAGHMAFLGRKVRESQQNGQEIVAENVVSIWAQMHAAAVDRAARVAKMALDAGVEEWQIRNAQRAGERLAAAVERAVFSVLDLSVAEKTQIGQRIEAEFERLAATDDDDVVEATAR